MKNWRAQGSHRRWRTIAAAVAVIAGLGVLFSQAPAFYHVPQEPDPEIAAPAAPEDPRREPEQHVRQMRGRELQRRFQEAVVMLHAGKFEYAIASLHRVLALSPRMPEAHVNMGFALVGLQNHGAARDFFLTATELNPRQANAYYGLAVAHEGLGEVPEAVGAMRTYLHLAGPDAAHQSKARAALWEWEALLEKERKDTRPGVTEQTPGATAPPIPARKAVRHD